MTTTDTKSLSTRHERGNFHGDELSGHHRIRHHRHRHHLIFVTVLAAGIRILQLIQCPRYTGFNLILRRANPEIRRNSERHHHGLSVHGIRLRLHERRGVVTPFLVVDRGLLLLVVGVRVQRSCSVGSHSNGTRGAVVAVSIVICSVTLAGGVRTLTAVRGVGAGWRVRSKRLMATVGWGGVN